MIVFIGVFLNKLKIIYNNMKKFTLVVEDSENEKNIPDIIRGRWEEFTSKDPYEFYHIMRKEGFDGRIILDAIGAFLD